jgi:intracellular sulfur oxidation DsrE/DsrF family protein
MNRGSFLAASASLVAATNATARAADPVPGGTHVVERKSDFDADAFNALVGKPADIRQLWEAVAFHPATFNNVKNALNGLQFGFGYAPERIAMVFAPHGPSSAYVFTDYVWSKYRIGEAFKLQDAKGNPVSSNVFLKPSKPMDRAVDPDLPTSFFQDTSIETLQSRGVIFLACHTAIEEQSRTLVNGGFAPAGMTATDVANDILTHLIPGTHVVPSMVATIAVLQQRFHYSYITLTLG